MKKIIPLLLAFCLVSNAGHAVEFSTMGQASAIVFKLMRGLVWMHGRVFNFDITFEYSPDDPMSWRVEAEIPVQGIQVIEQRISEQLQEDGVLFKHVEYPIIYFDSTEVVSGDSENAVIRGMLSINGIEKETDLKVHINGVNTFSTEEGQRTAIGIHAQAVIKRSDFDILWPRERKKQKLMGGSKFSDEVHLEFDLIGMEIQ